MDKIKQIQSLLGVTVDGVWGPKSQAALDAAKAEEVAAPRWPFTAAFVGDDIVVENVVITCFGGWGTGINDPQDKGETASGVNTRTSKVVGVSIPMDGREFNGLSLAVHRALDGCPIPRLRNSLGLTAWRTPVEVKINGKVWVPPDGIIDLGPGLQASSPGEPHGLDLTTWAAMFFRPDATLQELARNFSARGSYRIIGGAKLLK